MKENKYCHACGTDWYEDGPCVWCLIGEHMDDRGFRPDIILWPDIYDMIPMRSPCDNGSCDNSNNGCVIMGHCDESGEGKRFLWTFGIPTMHPDEVAWDLNRKTFYEEDIFPGGDYV